VYDAQWAAKLKFIGEHFTSPPISFLSTATPFGQAVAYANQLVKYFGGVVDDHKNNPQKYNDGLSRILKEMAKTGVSMTTDQLAREVYHIVFAGQGIWTVASNFVLNIASRSSVFKMLQLEVDQHPEVFQGGMTVAKVQKLQYMDNAMKESMRWSPQFVAINATSTKEFVYEGQFTIPANTWTILMPGATSRDPVAFPQPDQFEPERWIGKSEKQMEWAHIPLGGGPITGHKCLGSDLSPILSKVIALYMLRDYTWSVDNPKQGFNLAIPAPPPKDGLKVSNFKKRQ